MTSAAAPRFWQRRLAGAPELAVASSAVATAVTFAILAAPLDEDEVSIALAFSAVLAFLPTAVLAPSWRHRLACALAMPLSWIAVSALVVSTRGTEMTYLAPLGLLPWLAAALVDALTHGGRWFVARAAVFSGVCATALVDVTNGVTLALVALPVAHLLVRTAALPRPTLRRLSAAGLTLVSAGLSVLLISALVAWFDVNWLRVLPVEAMTGGWSVDFGQAEALRRLVVEREWALFGLACVIVGAVPAMQRLVGVEGVLAGAASLWGAGETFVDTHALAVAAAPLLAVCWASPCAHRAWRAAATLLVVLAALLAAVPTLALRRSPWSPTSLADAAASYPWPCTAGVLFLLLAVWATQRSPFVLGPEISTGPSR